MRKRTIRKRGASGKGSISKHGIERLEAAEASLRYPVIEQLRAQLRDISRQLQISQSTIRGLQEDKAMLIRKAQRVEALEKLVEELNRGDFWGLNR